MSICTIDSYVGDVDMPPPSTSASRLDGTGRWQKEEIISGSVC